jgi:hypothetical protein
MEMTDLDFEKTSYGREAKVFFPNGYGCLFTDTRNGAGNNPMGMLALLKGDEKYWNLQKSFNFKGGLVPADVDFFLFLVMNLKETA